MNIDHLAASVVYEELQANQKRLNECKRHHFPTFPEVTLGMKLDCSKCGGRMDAVHAYAYAKGYAAAGGDANDIFPHWS